MYKDDMFHDTEPILKTWRIIEWWEVKLLPRSVTLPWINPSALIWPGQQRSFTDTTVNVLEGGRIEGRGLPTWFGPVPAPHQSRAWGCRCWRTGWRLWRPAACPPATPGTHLPPVRAVLLRAASSAVAALASHLIGHLAAQLALDPLHAQEVSILRGVVFCSGGLSGHLLFFSHPLVHLAHVLEAGARCVIQVLHVDDSRAATLHAHTNTHTGPVSWPFRGGCEILLICLLRLLSVRLMMMLQKKAPRVCGFFFPFIS